MFQSRNHGHYSENDHILQQYSLWLTGLSEAFERSIHNALLLEEGALRM
jgi:hypothetical protein